MLQILLFIGTQLSKIVIEFYITELDIFPTILEVT